MEQVVIQSEQTPASGPNDAELAARGEAAVNSGNTHGEQPVNNNEVQRPDWVPEKFWDATKGEANYEAMAKSYKELEQSRNKPQEGVQKIETVEQAKELAVTKGIDFDALSREYQSNNGDLTDETYKSLEEKGIPKSAVQDFVKGQQAQAQLFRQEALKEVGGEDRYNEMTSWAKENLSQQEISAYNRAVNSGDVDVAKLAMAALKGKFTDANGTPPKTQVGGKQGRSSMEPFQSRTQYVDAIKDARYDRDPAYRNEVLKRLEASDIF